MNIIFGREHALSMEEKYTVLELDTFRVQPAGKEMTAFCVIESIPILDMVKVQSMKELHKNLLIEYRKKNWNYCLQAMEHLEGFWGNDLDTFYSDIRARIQEHMETDPGQDWDGVVEKFS